MQEGVAFNGTNTKTTVVQFQVSIQNCVGTVGKLVSYISILPDTKHLLIIKALLYGNAVYCVFYLPKSFYLMNYKQVHLGHRQRDQLFE